METGKKKKEKKKKISVCQDWGKGGMNWYRTQFRAMRLFYMVV